MNIKLEKDIFAPMKFLDQELVYYKNGYPSPTTENYYETLIKIRDIQNSGVVPNKELYQQVGAKREAFMTVEYGYYYANIHYYLFQTCIEYSKDNKYKELLNKRILYFLKNAEEDPLFAYMWFPLNFPTNYLRFLTNFYSQKVEPFEQEDYEQYEKETKTLVSFVNQFGDDNEKEIVNLLLALFKI